jgi:PhnB protein
MSDYIDMVVVPVPKESIAEYKKMAERFLEVWRDHGALSCVEVQGDDVPVGEITSFPRSVALQDNEAVFVVMLTFRSRAHRDEVKAKAMKDPRMAGMGPKAMPFDTKRMFWGGFKPFLASPARSTTVQPYIFFRGRCEEAINYYQARLGAEVLIQMRFKDNPDKPSPDKVPAAFDDRIMHACLRIAGADIMMSDGMRSGPTDFDCMSLSLSLPTEAEADRIFNALAADGKITMPIGKTFFAQRFGGVTDKFGVSWMVIVQPTA